MGKFMLKPYELNGPCQSHYCDGRIAYILGKDDDPIGTPMLICENCAQELIENIVNSVEFIKPPELPFEEDPDTFLGKRIVDWTVAELKEEAERLNLTGYSKKNKAELIHAIKDAEK